MKTAIKTKVTRGFSYKFQVFRDSNNYNKLYASIYSPLSNTSPMVEFELKSEAYVKDVYITWCWSCNYDLAMLQEKIDNNNLFHASAIPTP